MQLFVAAVALVTSGFVVLDSLLFIPSSELHCGVSLLNEEEEDEEGEEEEEEGGCEHIWQLHLICYISLASSLPLVINNCNINEN